MARKAKESKETMPVTTVQPTGYLALRDFDFASIISKEMDGLDAFFERIKMPSGDTTLFQIPSEDPENPEFEKEFSAVILHHHPIRAYFKEKFTGASIPPDCGSLDGVIGNGNPSGECQKCAFNGENGSKACKEQQRLYLLREGELFPILLSLPTGSLRELGRYIMRLLSKGLKSNDVVTKFSLVKATNKGGIAYAKGTFKLERKLTAEELPLIANLSEQIKALSCNVGFEDVDTEPAVLSGGAKNPLPLQQIA